MYQLIVPRRLNHMGSRSGANGDLSRREVPAERAGEQDNLAGDVLSLANNARSYVEHASISIDADRVLFAYGQV